MFKSTMLIILLVLWPAHSKDDVELSLTGLFNLKVITPSRFSEDLNETPNVVYILTKKDVKRRGIHSLEQVLKAIPGMGSMMGDLGYFSQVRGIAPNAHNKVTYMVNSHAINPLSETNNGTGPITLDNVKAIEIIIGPGSVMYGSETLLATINIITEQVDGFKVTGRLGQDLTEAADPFTYKTGTISFGKQVEDEFGISASLTLHTQGGFEAFGRADLDNTITQKKTDLLEPTQSIVVP